MQELSKAAREILAQLREVESSEGAARDRVRRRLALSIGSATAAAIGATSATAAATTAMSAPAALASSASIVTLGVATSAVSAGKVALLVAVGALAGGAVLSPIALLSTASPATSAVSQSRAVTHPSPSATPRSAPVRARVAGPAPRPAFTPVPLPPSNVLPSRRARRVSEPTVKGTLAAETRLLESAREHLRAGNANETLSLLEQHARRFPSGVLAEEAAASRVLALCALERFVEADAENARFRVTFPRSPLGPGIDRACAR